LQAGFLPGGSDSSIRQESVFTAHDVIAQAYSDITMATTASTTAATAGSVLYDAGKNIDVATITASSGVVTLKVGVAGEITDTGSDTEINITANALNIIGHGVVNTSAKPNEATLAAMRSQAIETEVDRAFVASYSNADAKMDYQVGQNVTGVLRENNGWSVQFVNNAFFVPVKSFVSSDAASLSVQNSGAATKSVATWQYTRDLNFQLLEYLAAKSETVRSQYATTAIGSIVPADLALYKQSARFADVVLTRSYPVTVASAVELFNRAGLDSDMLEIDSSSIIPTFGTAVFDKMVANDVHESPQFEYWIENLMF
jgi:hypothetical protein